MKNIIQYLSLLLIAATYGGCCYDPITVGPCEYLITEYNGNLSGQQNFWVVERTPFVYYTDMYVQVSPLSNEINELVIDGVTVSGSNNNFSIDKIEISECDESDCKPKDYVKQSEFTQEQAKTRTNVAAVLVLDFSYSVSAEAADIKAYAKSFLQEIANSTDSSLVSVIFFSDRVDAYQGGQFELSDNIGGLIQFIDTYKVSNLGFTKLYDGTLLGIQMLNNIGEFKGTKNVIVFTDGRDNDSDNGDTKLALIKESGGVKRFLIGVEGDDFDKKELKDMVSKSSNFVTVKNFDDLETAFDKVREQVTNVYRIIYQRSNAILDNPIRVKFHFHVKKL